MDAGIVVMSASFVDFGEPMDCGEPLNVGEPDAWDPWTWINRAMVRFAGIMLARKRGP
jgi:hypothetical protein